MSKKIGILHISDLHIADTVYTDNSKSRLQNSAYLINLREFIKEQKQSQSLNRLYLVISGDITQGADPGEFEEADKVIRSMCNDLAIEKKDVLIVPGNHDINWAKIIERLRKEKFQDRDKFYTRKDLKYTEFKEFYDKFYENGKIFSYDKSIFDVVIIEEIKTIMLAVNTLVHESQLKQDHYGFIDVEKLNNDLQGINKNYKNYKRIAVMHHNPSASGGETSSIKNWNEVCGIFESHGVNTFLCGHTHVTESHTETRKDSKNYLTTGSIGKSDVELHNSFLILTGESGRNPVLSSKYYMYSSNAGVRSYWSSDDANPNTIAEIKL